MEVTLTGEWQLNSLIGLNTKSLEITIIYNLYLITFHAVLPINNYAKKNVLDFSELV